MHARIGTMIYDSELPCYGRTHVRANINATRRAQQLDQSLLSSHARIVYRTCACLRWARFHGGAAAPYKVISRWSAAHIIIWTWPHEPPVTDATLLEAMVQKGVPRPRLKTCEECQLKQPKFGLVEERKKRWCPACATRHPEAVLIVTRWTCFFSHYRNGCACEFLHKILACLQKEMRRLPAEATQLRAPQPGRTALVQRLRKESSRRR